ncbi:Glucuronosyltransferase [Aphelenchoides bicaudatus]|nr:Glucuronosyltransferase [Aphelenchoides bicaudatus]
MKILVVLLLQLCTVYSAKYLVYNVKFSRSHTIYMNRIADTLAKHGHEVPIYSEEFNDTGTKFAKTINRELSFPIDFDQAFMHEFVWSKETIQESTKAFTVGIKMFYEMFAKNCKDQLQDTKMIERLRKENFDLMIMEYFDPCSIAIKEKVGIKKHIAIYSMPMPQLANLILGLPSSLSFVPDLYASQTPRMVIYIGGLIGLNDKKANKLPENLEKVYQKASKGVVFMSFGTVAPSYVMPADYKKAFLEAFAEFPDYEFLWKYEKPEHKVAGNHSNVHDLAWFPQRDILLHPKTKLFISHAGQNSLSEASYSGQPILCIPLFADQFRNAQTAKWHGYGEMLDKTNLTKEAIVEGIRKIISNDNYRQRAKDMSKILNSKPVPAEEIFIKNVEFATQFDLHKQLDMYGRNLSTIEYYNIDVVFSFFAVVFISLYIFYRLVKLIVWCLYVVYNPIYAPSHVTFADKIAKTLRQAGHTVIQINSVQTMNFDPKKLDHPDNWIRWPKTIEVKDEIPSRLAKEMWEQDGLSLKELFKQFHDVGSHHARHCEDQLQDEEYLQRLREEQFDLAITEFYDICGTGIFEKIGVKKYIAFTPFPMMLYLLEALGLPLGSSFVPDLSTVSGPDMSFSMRVRNFGSSWLVGSVNKWSLSGYTEKVIQKYVNPNFDATERIAEASYYFVNSDAILDFNRPISDKYIHIGGLGISDTSNKPLDATFQQIMDSSKNGVILVSFGTIALSHEIPQRIKQIFLDAFVHFPNYTFLWKYEKPEHRISSNYSNVVEATYGSRNATYLVSNVFDTTLTTSYISAHPKLMGFLTHGGLNSIMESAYGGVPVISIGLFGDQQRNAKMAEYRGFGIYLDKTNLTKDSLIENLRELIENNKYRQKAKEIAQMLKEKPLQAEELVVKYTEYATKFDVHKYLDLPGRHMSFIKLSQSGCNCFFHVHCSAYAINCYWRPLCTFKGGRLCLQAFVWETRLQIASCQKK